MKVRDPDAGGDGPPDTEDLRSLVPPAAGSWAERRKHAPAAWDTRTIRRAMEGQNG